MSDTQHLRGEDVTKRSSPLNIENQTKIGPLSDDDKTNKNISSNITSNTTVFIWFAISVGLYLHKQSLEGYDVRR